MTGLPPPSRPSRKSAQTIFGPVGGHLVGSVVLILLGDPDFRSRVMEEARAADPRKLRNEGWRLTSVRLLGGVVLLFRTPYVSPDRSGSPGPRRGDGRRGKGGAGCFPSLMASSWPPVFTTARLPPLPAWWPGLVPAVPASRKRAKRSESTGSKWTQRRLVASRSTWARQPFGSGKRGSTRRRKAVPSGRSLPEGAS